MDIIIEMKKFERRKIESSNKVNFQWFVAMAFQLSSWIVNVDTTSLSLPLSPLEIVLATFRRREK